MLKIEMLIIILKTVTSLAVIAINEWNNTEHIWWNL